MYGKNKNPHLKTENPSIRLNEVLSRTGYGRTSIYRKMEDGSFPKSVKLGNPLEDPNAFNCRAVAWIEDEVDEWVDSRIEERNLGSTDFSTNQNIDG